MSLISICNFSRINRCIQNFKYLERSKCTSNHLSKIIHPIHRERITAAEICRNFSLGMNAYQQLTWIRLLSTSSLLAAKKDKENESSSTNIKKKYDSPLITLIDKEDKLSVLSLSQAERLAKRRDLKLVKIEDPTLRKQERPIYKLFTGKEYFDEQMSKKVEMGKDASGVKGEKTVMITGQIEKHDLESKLKNVIKWIKKRHRVRVTISAGKSNEDARDKVMKMMEESVAPVGGRLLQVREKGDNIKFYIEPPTITVNDQRSV